MPFASEELPFFSVIVPTYDRPGPLAACLEALRRLDYPRDRYEIIVVNDGGSELPASLVAPGDESPEIHLLAQRNAGPAAARNAGVRRARGSHIAFTDDDCTPSPGWLSALAAEFLDSPGALIGGHTTNRLTQNTYSAASHSLILALYAYYNRNPRQARFFTSNNLALPVERYWSFGGFDESFPMAAAEDRDLCDRWSDKGWPILYAPDAEVAHAHDLDLRSFLGQHFRYGRGALHFQRRRRARSKPTTIEPFGFYHGLLTHPWNEGLGWRKWPVTALIVASQLANAAGYWWEGMRSRS